METSLEDGGRGTSSVSASDDPNPNPNPGTPATNVTPSRVITPITTTPRNKTLFQGFEWYCPADYKH
ncbi:hypothetical protein MGN70_004166 [Eutypa lata]|nr:hypothetical protein MGN70_004166 [Eutypa lata]